MELAPTQTQNLLNSIHHTGRNICGALSCYLFLLLLLQVDAVAHEEISNVIHNYDICVVKMMRLNADIISRAKQLKLIVQYGVGLEGHSYSFCSY